MPALASLMVPLLVLAAGSSARGADNVGGYATSMEFMVAELQKQDTATFADAVLGIWNERNISNDLFCKIMQSDPATFQLWLKGLKENAFSGSSDTACKRLEKWRAEIIDPSGTWLKYYAGCEKLDTQIVEVVKSLNVRRVPERQPLGYDAACRRARYWFVQWHNRTRIAWMKLGPPLFDLLLEEPNAFYFVMGGSPEDFNQFVGNLDELRFTNFADTATAPLEMIRTEALARLQKADIGNRYEGLNSRVITRLKGLKVRSIHKF